MKLKFIIIGGIILVLALCIYAAARRAEPVPLQNSSASTTSGIRIAPDFELRTLDGRAVRLSDFRGKAVVLNFWATYCAPCRVETPWLVELYRQYQSQGLEIIGVSMDDQGEAQQVADFVREFGVNYAIVLGNHAVGDAYGGARFLPQTFFIDRDGHIKRSAINMKNKIEVEVVIKELLANASQKSN